MALKDYPTLLNSPNNKRRSTPSSKKGKSKTKIQHEGRTSRHSPKHLSPTKRDLVSHRYFTSPENDDIDYKTRNRSQGAKRSDSAREDKLIRNLRIKEMIEEREVEEERQRAEIYDRRKTQALLSAASIENDILKDALFNNSVHQAAKCNEDIGVLEISKNGPVIREVLSSTPVTPDIGFGKDEKKEETINDLTRDDYSGEDNESGEHVKQNISTQSQTPLKIDMSSSYREEDFTSSIHYKDKSINTSPTPRKSPLLWGNKRQEWLSPPPPRGGRTASPEKSSYLARGTRDASPPYSDAHVDTPDIGSDVSDRSSPKKVSFMDDTVTDKSLQIKLLESDLQRKDLEVMELRHNTLNLKRQLGESESTRVALESEKLRLSLQNITSPRVVAPSVSPRLVQPAVAAGAGTGPAPLTPHDYSHVTTSRDPRQDIASAQKDISEVNNMLHELRSENNALRASLKQVTVQTQLQTQQLEDKIQVLTKERDNFANENKRFQRLISQDDKGSRIGMLQRDLQNQLTENEKLKCHLQTLRDSYTKFFGGTI